MQLLDGKKNSRRYQSEIALKYKNERQWEKVPHLAALIVENAV
jgi:hypothetical protein